MCVGEDLEDLFLKLGNQKHTLINIIYQFITSDENFIGIYYVCEECDIPLYYSNGESYWLFL